MGNKGESEVSSVVSVMFSPPLDKTVATTMHAATEFLYTGDNRRADGQVRPFEKPSSSTRGTIPFRLVLRRARSNLCEWRFCVGR